MTYRPTLSRHIYPWLIYLAVGLLVMGPLLIPGYVLTYDMGWGPRIPAPDTGSSTYPLYTLLAALTTALPSWLVQKIMLLSLFCLMGTGAYSLARLAHTAAKDPAPTLRVLVAHPELWAGLAYTINPFTYTRLMAGQWLVLAGYALLPWIVRALWLLWQQPGWRRAAIALGWLTAVGWSSVHTLGFVPLIALVLLVASGRRQWPQKLGWLTAIAAGWLAINSWWLVQAFSRDQAGIGSQIAQFGDSQFAAFATQPTLGSVPLSAALLTGFWGDPQHRYLLPSATGLLWWLGVAVIAGIVAYGLYRVVALRDRLGIGLAILGIVAWWLAMGIAWGPSASTTQWLVTHIPLYAGYREPHKWLILTALADAYLGAYGLHALLQKRHIPNASLAVALALPLLAAPAMPWGGLGQLRSVPYPRDWAVAYDTIRNDSSTAPAVVLPWHMYIYTSWAARPVANPAGYYFGSQAITGNDPELRGVRPDYGNSIADDLTLRLLPQRHEHTDIAQQLGRRGVHHILLLKEADWRSYDWLDAQAQLRLVQDTPTLRLYKIETRP